VAPEGHRRTQWVVRVVCHVVAEVPFLAVALAQIVQGWRPTSDDAMIAIRSWAVFTSRPPLVGEVSQVSGCAGQLAFHPGPLLYWMLAVPVRVDPAHGVLWGAAVWCAVAMAVCVEGAWAVRRAWGALAVAGAGVVLAATQPDVFVRSMWDPYFGVVWFGATCIAAWVVGKGRLRWWPVLVLAASVAAQTHLEYSVPAALLAIVAPLPHVRRWLGGADGRTWLPVGTVVGAACWAAPLVQQVSGHPGNLSLLMRCVGGQRTMGGRFGLETLGAAVVPPPLWFHHPPGSFGVVHVLTARPAGAGIAILAALALVSVVTWTTHRRDLAVLAAVALVVAGSTVWEFAVQPTSTVLDLSYLDVLLWPVGMLVWGVAALSVVEVVATWRGASRRWGLFGAARSPASRQLDHRLLPKRAGAALLWGVTAAVLVGGTVNASFLAGGAMSQVTQEVGGRGTFRAVSALATAAERVVPRGPLIISISAQNAMDSYVLLYGALWVLISQGRQATAPGFYANTISPPAYTVPGEPWVALRVRADGSVASAEIVSRSGAGVRHGGTALG